MVNEVLSHLLLSALILGQGSTEDLSAQPSTLAGGPWGLDVSGTQHQLQAARLGVLISRLETLLHHQEAQEKELRTLNSKVIHLATILKVGTHLHLALIQLVKHKML